MLSGVKSLNVIVPRKLSKRLCTNSMAGTDVLGSTARGEIQKLSKICRFGTHSCFWKRWKRKKEFSLFPVLSELSSKLSMPFSLVFMQNYVPNILLILRNGIMTLVP